MLSARQQHEGRVAAVRRFNRFYTRQIGVLRRNFLDSPYTLSEARVLYEIGQRPTPTATDVGRALGLDAAYLSRLLRKFEKSGLITRSAVPQDARQSHLTLTARGKKTMRALNTKSQRDVSDMLGKLTAADQGRLMAAMCTIEALLGGVSEEPRQSGTILRGPRHGDFGWIVQRHAELYAQEYGWKEPFEGVCAKIIADFLNTYDPQCERCWIAEMDGQNVGCVFIAKETVDVARLRLLLVEPKARGFGLGARLTDECIRFARSAGYRKITLWTHSVLTAARHIYRKAGFKLIRSEERISFGQQVVSEDWEMEL
ncbi:MAG TPA: bifunctional helix-turn-helix transcriptional regulator/GNAT family N-acetyltransferase [Xanthobacteraceae bacterium]|jgi:DNA-binding MarR family transcriptional regulator/GNAT superfamily N-acetyltransferase|nr:bifunctional helix-turn-helix transcriptional regulator/GNAT family N-acetyltransferase [Xanthobacteraceae bacterium]